MNEVQKRTQQELTDFCKNLGNLRRKNGYSKKKMAELLGISVYHLTKLEKGEIPPMISAGIFFRVQEVFGIPVCRQLFPLDV